MDSSLDGNPLKRSEMSADETKQLLRELSKEEDNKLTNDQIINKLSKTVPEEKDSSTTSKRNAKRQRKNANPTRYNVSERANETDGECTTIFRRNLAYVIRRQELFRKKYDDSKDAYLCDCVPPFAW